MAAALARSVLFPPVLHSRLPHGAPHIGMARKQTLPLCLMFSGNSVTCEMSVSLQLTSIAFDGSRMGCAGAPGFVSCALPSEAEV